MTIDRAEFLRTIATTGPAYYFWTSGASEGLQQFDRSRRLMHRDLLDLEQVHNLVDLKTPLAMLRRQKEQGDVRYIGVTHYTESSFIELEAVIRRERLDFVQLRYSIGFRGAEARLLPAAADTGAAVIVNGPLEGGDVFSRVRSTPLDDVAAGTGPLPDAEQRMRLVRFVAG